MCPLRSRLTGEVNESPRLLGSLQGGLDHRPRRIVEAERALALPSGRARGAVRRDRGRKPVGIRPLLEGAAHLEAGALLLRLQAIHAPGTERAHQPAQQDDAALGLFKLGPVLSARTRHHADDQMARRMPLHDAAPRYFRHWHHSRTPMPVPTLAAYQSSDRGTGGAVSFARRRPLLFPDPGVSPPHYYEGKRGCAPPPKRRGGRPERDAPPRKT